MPNYVRNIVTLIGDQDLIKKIKDSLKSESDGEINYFDFNNVIPMPDSLNITSGGSVDLGIDVINYLESGKISKELDINSPRLAVAQATNIDELVKYLLDNNRVNLDESRAAIDNLNSYGHKDWYTWRVSNWGTKWNSCGSFTEGDMICFDTAWSCPEEIYLELSRKYPDITINVKFADEDLGNNCGEFEVRNGMIDSLTNYDEVQACVVWGHDPYEIFPDLIRDRKIDNLFKK